MPKFVLSAIACILLMLVLAPRTHINPFESRGEWLLKSRGMGGGGVWVTWLSYLVASCNKWFIYLTTKLLFHFACESKKARFFIA